MRFTLGSKTKDSKSSDLMSECVSLGSGAFGREGKKKVGTLLPFPYIQVTKYMVRFTLGFKTKETPKSSDPMSECVSLGVEHLGGKARKR